MKEFRDKVAVVTGAASGIGRGLAERCAKEGMKIILADIEESPLKETEAMLKKGGASVLAVKTDVSNAAEVETLAQKTLDAFGAVHLLFNNAGVSAGSTIWDSTMVDWQWVLGVNLWGVINGVHFFVPIMLKQNTECHIVNTASAAGLISSSGAGPYCVSKHGVVVLSETLYYELAQISRNIDVSVICPGWIKTRILDCERNRPLALRNKPSNESGVVDKAAQDQRQMVMSLIENGMPPDQAAHIIFEAIRERKFYILPNAEIFKSMMKSRMEDIVHEHNPSAVFPKAE